MIDQLERDEDKELVRTPEAERAWEQAMDAEEAVKDGRPRPVVIREVYCPTCDADVPAPHPKH